jgi:hypothetical protein
MLQLKAYNVVTQASKREAFKEKDLTIDRVLNLIHRLVFDVILRHPLPVLSLS